MRPCHRAVCRPCPKPMWRVAPPRNVRAHARLRCFARGIITIVGMLIRGAGLVLGRFMPEPWPTHPSVPKKKNTKSKAHLAQEAA